jgi:uroporphyrinogen-III synthase
VCASGARHSSPLRTPLAYHRGDVVRRAISVSDPLPASALAGASVVVTRPAGTASSLLARARACGGSAVALPGLSLHEVGEPAAARSMLRAAHTADTWIFSSPAAAHYAFRLDPGLSIRADAAAFGVGAGTLRALARNGIRARAPGGSSDSEGLLALPELADVRGRRIALVGAPGGRGLLEAVLRERGALVESIHVYERRRPRLTRRHFEAVARAPDPLITLISSGEALANLVVLLPAELLARLRHQILIVSSARLAEFAGQHGFEDVREAASASPADLLDAARRALARHRL